jgi:hypothetical protein
MRVRLETAPTGGRRTRVCQQADPANPVSLCSQAVTAGGNRNKCGSPSDQVIESKMRYATDAVESKPYVVEAIAADAAKLRATPTVMPSLFLMWAPYFHRVRRRLRWMAGHEATTEGWRPRVTLDQCREAMEALLTPFGPGLQRVEVREAKGDDGQVTLDVWLAPVLRNRPSP